jgi:alkanesulfonate monooxygenase SsuD/methylene tetrahydromethanopterin reductase-like flavin-dependent oxidoreductase (luciferase family)
MEEADAGFDEALGFILKAWSADEPFSHRGRYWQFDNIVVEPPTAQRPHPPIRQQERKRLSGAGHRVAQG